MAEGGSVPALVLTGNAGHFRALPAELLDSSSGLCCDLDALSAPPFLLVTSALCHACGRCATGLRARTVLDSLALKQQAEKNRGTWPL